MFSLNFREALAPISRYLVEELEQTAASAHARWYVQHSSDGSHTDVTASSVTADLFAAGRLALPESRNTAPLEPVTRPETIQVAPPASPTAIVSVVPSSTADVTLWNLSTAGRSLGEVVILRAAYDYSLTHFGFVIRSLSSATTPSSAAKFFTPGDGLGTNYDAITLGVGESLVVRLESAQPTSTTSFSTYWRTLGKLSV